MADGFGRVRGGPGVCLVITGPGVTNALTPVAQAHHDSKPLLLLSAAVDPAAHGRGTIHDLPDQRRLTEQVTAFSHSATGIDDLADALARAWDVFGSARPRPVHIEVPVDVLRRPAGELPDPARPAPPPAADAEALRAAADLLAGAVRPVLVLGGGAAGAGAQALELAEWLDAPIGLSINARGAVDSGHPLCVGSAMCFPPVSDLLLGADVMLAVGTEFSELDWWYLDGPPRLPQSLVRVDIDADQLSSQPCTAAARRRRRDACVAGRAGARAAAPAGRRTPSGWPRRWPPCSGRATCRRTLSWWPPSTGRCRTTASSPPTPPSRPTPPTTRCRPTGRARG